MERSVMEPKRTILEFLIFLAGVFAGSSVGGWAYQMWKGEVIPLGKKIGGIILSGVAGCIVALLLWDSLHEKRALLAGVSLLAGIGGATTIDMLLASSFRNASVISALSKLRLTGARKGAPDEIEKRNN